MVPAHEPTDSDSRPAPAAMRNRFHDWASLRSELVWIYDDAPRVSHIQSDHTHALGHRAWYLRRGEVRIEIPGGVWEAQAGSWLMTPAALLKQDFSDDAHLLSVHFLCQWPTGENVFLRERGIVIPGSDFPLMEQSATALVKMVHRRFPSSGVDYAFQQASYPDFLKFQGLFADWLAAWFDAMSCVGAPFTHFRHGEDRLNSAVRCLNDIQLDRPFPREQLLKETGLSAVHLDRLFVREFGSTTRKYWEKRRLENAKMCLSHSSMPIKEIAYCLGFRYDSHFVGWFKRHCGVSPATYRNRTQKRNT
ncbi:MAG: helix-turn-helix transcriptional regulator [Candidatus Methylacidiphilales bacterium]